MHMDSLPRISMYLVTHYFRQKRSHSTAKTRIAQAPEDPIPQGSGVFRDCPFVS